MQEEQVMSEVHLGCPPRLSGPYISHFTFPLPPKDQLDGRYTHPMEASSSQMLNLDNDGDLILMRRNASSLVRNHGECSGNLCEEDESCSSTCQDEDGDLVLTRKYVMTQGSLNYRLTIRHNITSSLLNVGLQVWRAALVMADFVLHKSFTSSEFNGNTVIELGAGTGLVGIILARVARMIFLTDIGCEVLDNCATNARLNSSLLNFHEAAVRVRELDWKEPWPPTFDSSSQQRSEYSWGSSEIEEADGATLLLAADVVYSDQLTDSFFSILEKLMARGPKKVLYMALEKRYNFTLDDLDVVANGYQHFRSFLRDDQGCEGLDERLLPCFRGKQIDLADVPQYIREYERGKDVELWKVTYS